MRSSEGPSDPACQSRMLQCEILRCAARFCDSSVSGSPRRWRGGRRMETTMNVELISPAALVATLAGTSGGGRDEAPWRKLRARVGEEVRYPLALRELRRLDDRDLDDLDLGRGDLPGLARRHARERAG